MNFTSLTLLSSSDSIWMWLIFTVQIISMILMVDRTVALFGKRKVNQKELSKQIGEDIRAGDLSKALSRAATMGAEPFGAIATAGITVAMKMGSKEEIQFKMDELLLKEKTLMEKRIGFLAMFANLATFAGLLGTITGLIHALNGISNVDPAQKQNLLAKGISLAMNTTGYGLLVAVPALIMYAVFQSRATRLTDDLNKASLNLFIQLGFHYEPTSEQKRNGLKSV